MPKVAKPLGCIALIVGALVLASGGAVVMSHLTKAAWSIPILFVWGLLCGLVAGLTICRIVFGYWLWEKR